MLGGDENNFFPWIDIYAIQINKYYQILLWEVCKWRIVYEGNVPYFP